MHDLRYAFRQLVKTPGFTVVALATLALGIGANSAIFSLVNSVMLRPLPYPEPQQLALIWNNNTREGIPDDITSWPTFNDWRTQNKTFSSMAGYSPGSANLTGDGEPIQVRTTRAGDRFFETLGVPALRGRWFTDEEQTPGNDSVAIIGHGLWQRRFGGVPGVIGQSIQVNGQPRTIVGIMPPDFEFPARTDLYIPIAPSDGMRNSRHSFWLPVVGRMAPGTAIEQAQADLTVINNAIIEREPALDGYLVNVASLHGWLVRNVGTALWVLLGAVGCVLLIACANLANLLLARGIARRREMAIRIALGASRRQVVRQLLVESTVLAVAGGVFGVLVGFWGLEAVKHFGGADIPRVETIQIDGTVLALTLGASLVCGLAFGLAPALQAARIDPHDALKDGGRGASAGRSTQLARAALVVAQAALAVVLLVGAGLLLRSFWKLSQVDTGIRGDELVSVPLSLPRTKYKDGPATSAFYAQLLERVAAVPGVQSTGLTTSILLNRLHNSGIFTVEGRPPEPEGKRLELPIDSASPTYFSTMGIPIVEGRAFTDADGPNAGAAVVIINETMARRYWPGESAIGRRFHFGDPPAPSADGKPQDPNWLTVVGVVRDTRRQGADRPIRIESWLPVALRPSRSVNLIVRSSLPAATIARSLREAVWSIDRDLPVPRVEAVTALLDERTAQRRLNMNLLGAFAGIALVLAAIGLYGVMAYSVGQRRGEFGIRLALGAEPGDLLRLVFSQGARLVSLGLTIGLLVAVALGSLMQSLLYETPTRDWLTYAAVIGVLGAAASIAMLLPARRAAKVDPLEALRSE